MPLIRNNATLTIRRDTYDEATGRGESGSGAPVVAANVACFIGRASFDSAWGVNFDDFSEENFFVCRLPKVTNVRDGDFASGYVDLTTEPTAREASYLVRRVRGQMAGVPHMMALLTETNT